MEEEEIRRRKEEEDKEKEGRRRGKRSQCLPKTRKERRRKRCKRGERVKYASPLKDDRVLCQWHCL